MPSRQQVLWTGGTPDETTEDAFRRRRLALTQVGDLTDDDLSVSSAAIFNITRYSGSIAARLSADVPRCISHGVWPIIRCDSATVRIVQDRLADFKDQYLTIESSVGPDDLAEEAREGREDPGPSFNKNLKISGAALDGEDLLLLQRAFSDCTEIELLALTEGKSNALVFRAHARFGPAAPTTFLLPFLIKLDAASNIKTELTNFRSYVAPHVPFSHRPNVESGRSLIGATRGVLVGDFVEDATSLSRLCKDPVGRHAIYSLFDDALRSWRRHAYADPTTARVPFTDLMPGLIKEAEILPEIVDLARKYRLKSSPSDLVDRLKKASAFRYQRGIIHGDLHPGNVMVRGSEPILIDFFSIWPAAPLVADVACMEVAVCFTIAPESAALGRSKVHQKPFRSWKKEVDALFAEKCLDYVPPLQEPPSDFNWLWSICRQTRVMAHLVGADRGPYEAALVAYLLRRARLGGNPSENLRIAAYALRTAETVLECLERRAKK